MKKQFFSLFMAFGLISILTVSCNQEALDMTPNTYSGEEYFKSIFLLQGKLTEHIPSLKHFTKYKQVESEEQVRAKINHINQLDPSFFSDLTTAIVSKNANDLEMVLDRGGALLDMLNVQKHTTDTKLEANLQQIDLSKYDFTKASDVEIFVNTVRQVAGEHSDLMYNEAHEVEKGIVTPTIVAAHWVIIRWVFISRVDGNVGVLTDTDSFFKEKLVSDIIHLSDL